MASSMQPRMADPSTAGGMGGMEEAVDTVGVPPLVDDRTLSQFCQAVQKCADGTGFHDQAQEKIKDLRERLQKLQALAQLCRLAVLGLPGACEQARDEMHCVAVDFPADPIVPPEECDMDAGGPCKGSDYKGPAQFAAALDLLTGAAFVSKDDPAQRDRFIVGVVRAIENAICYPVAYATEAAAYLGIGPSMYPTAQLLALIATATARFLEGDFQCDPRLPIRVQARLEHLACKWMRANPVTELFSALTGPRWDDALQSIQPSSANVGDEVTLRLRSCCSDQMGNTQVGNTQAGNTAPGSTPGPNSPAGNAQGNSASNTRTDVSLKDLRVLFCPRQRAPILQYSSSQIVVRVPPGSRSGPIAIVRDFGATLLGDIVYLLNRYACEYPFEWDYSVFTLIPMWQWAYPVAFGCPQIKIAFVPQTATVKTFSKYGQLQASSTVQVNDVVAIYYQVDPPGSDQQTPVQVTASSGTLSNVGVPGAIGFTPSSPGDVSIKLTWGSLTSTVALHVVRGPA